MSKSSSPTAGSSAMEKPTKEEMDAIRSVDDTLAFLNPPPKRSRFVTKAKENPFVPIGCLATVFALCYGLLQFNRGNQKLSQRAMRMRVVAQGGTVIALVMGSIMAGREGKKNAPVEPTEAKSIQSKPIERDNKNTKPKS